MFSLSVIFILLIHAAQKAFTLPACVYSSSTCVVSVIYLTKLLPQSLQKASVSVFDDSLLTQLLRSLNLFKQSLDCDEATTEKETGNYNDGKNGPHLVRVCIIKKSKV